VVSKVRKVLKFPASCCEPTMLAAEAVELVELVVGIVVVVVVMVDPQTISVYTRMSTPPPRFQRE
jgi:hypothetical protein